ncbi:MAG: hypothetical protein NT124_00315 [Candidatus Dependentiae bacterium]|nr:hypothetical protein [Candidatus Dependentiae bacterium]
MNKKILFSVILLLGSIPIPISSAEAMDDELPPVKNDKLRLTRGPQIYNQRPLTQKELLKREIEHARSMARLIEAGTLKNPDFSAVYYKDKANRLERELNQLG